MRPLRGAEAGAYPETMEILADRHLMARIDDSRQDMSLDEFPAAEAEGRAN